MRDMLYASRAVFYSTSTWQDRRGGESLERTLYVRVRLRLSRMFGGKGVGKGDEFGKRSALSGSSDLQKKLRVRVEFEGCVLQGLTTIKKVIAKEEQWVVREWGVERSEQRVTITNPDASVSVGHLRFSALSRELHSLAA